MTGSVRRVDSARFSRFRCNVWILLEDGNRCARWLMFRRTGQRRSVKHWRIWIGGKMVVPRFDHLFTALSNSSSHALNTTSFTYRTPRNSRWTRQTALVPIHRIPSSTLGERFSRSPSPHGSTPKQDRLKISQRTKLRHVSPIDASVTSLAV